MTETAAVSPKKARKKIAGRPPSTSRTRLARERERAGLRCYTITANEDGLARLLIANKMLSPLAADDREAQRAGLEHLVDALISE